MSTIITANFENIDFASIALSKVRKNNKDLNYLRIKNKYKNKFTLNQPHTITALAYYSQVPFDTMEYGGYLIPFSENFNSYANTRDYTNKSVTVEIATDNKNYNKICNQLRTNGGYDIKVIV